MKKTLLISLSLSLLMAPLFGFAADAPMEDKGKAVFEEKCNLCHTVDKPLSKNKDHDGWLSTVKRMQNKAGGRISDDDVKQIVDYLDKVRGPK